jgi:hypothetical protein
MNFPEDGHNEIPHSNDEKEDSQNQEPQRSLPI